MLVALFALLALLPLWTYQVAAEGETLIVLAKFPAGSSAELIVEPGAAPYLRELQLLSGSAAAPIALRGDSWLVPACAAKGCTLRYRFALGEAAGDLNTADMAARYGELLEAPPATWLLRPRSSGEARLRLRVTAAFVTGLPEVAPATWELDARDLRLAPYSAFGKVSSRWLKVGAQRLQVAFAQAPRTASEDAISEWVRASAAAVAGYFGRLPVDGTLILVLSSRGTETHGRTLGGGGASVLLWLGDDLPAARLRDDWVLVHELVHTGFPYLDREHHWAEEGLATYLEPIARVRAGSLAVAKFWADLLRGLPKGEPGPFDSGLDGTSNWGRTYWGGALFWLLADVRIRERTQGRWSLEDALRGVLAAGGNITSRWDFTRALRIGDKSVGVAALEPLYQEMGKSAVRVDLSALFAQLGVSLREGQVQFDDSARLAGVRRAITEPSAKARGGAGASVAH